MLPLLLGFSGVSILIGIAKGKEGLDNIKEARRRGEAAQRRHENSSNQLNAQWEKTNDLAAIYGKLQVRVGTKVVKRFVDLIQRSGRKASFADQQLLNELEGVSIEELEEFKAFAFDAEQILKDVQKATAAGFGAGSATVGVANTIGTVAVPQFFGLFTKQVAVSQLGLPGVALYLGGGNLVLGGAILGGVSIAPALAIGGFQYASKGEKALTQAQDYEAKVNTRIAKNKSKQELLKRTEKRIREIGTLVRKIEKLASQQLDELEAHERNFHSLQQRIWRACREFLAIILGCLVEGQTYEKAKQGSKKFDVAQDVLKFQQTALLIKALVEIIKTPVLDNRGNINSLSITVQEKYKETGSSSL